MKCPACENNLSQIVIGDIELDVCQEGCGGIWFDANEILKFDEQHEFPESDLLTLNHDKRTKVSLDGPRSCPKCENQILVRQFFDVKNEVEIDQCWNCAGIWLDTGELVAIRNQYLNYEERAKEVNQYLDGILTSHRKAIEASTKKEIAENEERYSSRINALLTGLQELLGN